MIETLGLAEIYKPIKSDLDHFNSLIRKELSSRDPFIHRIYEHLLNISGKNLRPALAILSARLLGNRTETPIRVAMAIELLHTATLIHDDIIDGSMYRRNQPSMNAKWGIEISIICGDHLYSKAFTILSELADPTINKMFSTCARTMCEGEMKQVETRKDTELGEAAYIEIILKKTASLFQAACAAGGYLAQQPPGTIQRIGEYGKNYGLLFQINDDCMDLVGNDEELGKKAGLDFDKSDPTLPLIYLFQNLSATAREEFKKITNGASAPEKADYFERVRAMVLREGIPERCMALARRYGADALAALEGFPDSPCRKSLVDLVDYTLQRVS